MNIVSTMKVFLSVFLANSFFIVSTPTELSFTLPFIAIEPADKTAFFLIDSAQNNFVLKYHPRGAKRAIHDTLGAYIGKSIDLNINDVEVFAAHHPYAQLFIEKCPNNTSHVPITIHSLVPGVSVRSIKRMDKAICIKKGLCKERHLKSLISYPQLCEVVAFDIFIDNTDRHNGNLFFDEFSGKFYIIDLDHGFKSASFLINISDSYDFRTVATRTYYFLKKSIAKRSLSAGEIAILKKIRKTLQKLVYLYSPETIFKEWMMIAEKAEVIYSQREQAKIKKYLMYHIQEVTRVITLLNDIIT